MSQLDALAEGLLQPLLLVGQAEEATLARREVTGLGVEQHQLQIVAGQLGGDLFNAVLIRKEHLDLREAGGGGSSVALSHRDFVEEQVEVGGETGHASLRMRSAGS